MNIRGRAGYGTNRLSKRSLNVAWAAAVLLVGFGTRARADRIVLAPRGLIAAPSTVGAEYAALAADGRTNLGWITFGVPQQDLGLELEAERLQVGSRHRETLSLQYSLTGNAFSDIAPAISVGVRDVLNRGIEGRAFFAAATKTFGMSRQQERFIRNWQLSIGYGTSRLDGPYVGLQSRLTLGLRASAELVGRRFNGSLALPLARYLSLKAYTLDGATYYGASFVVAR